MEIKPEDVTATVDAAVAATLKDMAQVNQRQHETEQQIKDRVSQQINQQAEQQIGQEAATLMFGRVISTYVSDLQRLAAEIAILNHRLKVADEKYNQLLVDKNG